MEIRVDDLTGPEVHQLLAEHMLGMQAESPPECVHALDLTGLRKPEITFWTVWEGSELLGCGAIKELDPRHGELKSMRTRAKHLRKGVARALLRHILAVAKERGYARLSLETGSTAGFVAAHKLYAEEGFVLGPAFGDYKEDPFSVFMEKLL
jgi:putative acetyltransferase